MKKNIICLIIISGWAGWIYANNLSPLKIRYITVEEGLSHINVNSIFQDSKAFLWINSNQGHTGFIKSDKNFQNFSGITLLHEPFFRWRFFIIITIIIFIGALIYFIWRSHKQSLEKKRIAEWAEDSIEIERENLRTLIFNMPDVIYIKDRDSKFIMGNNRVAEVMKAGSPNNLIGKSDFDFYPHEMAIEYYNDEQEIIKTGKPLIGKSEPGYDIQGNKCVLSTTKIPLKNKKGEIIGVLGIGRDITQLTIIENELRENSDILQETNTLLEERQEKIEQQAETLKVQADTLKKINTELEISNKTKDKFFSIIAHDLKNPFSSILGFIDLLDINYDKWSDEKKHKIIKILKNSSESIYNLLENLLQWSRTQRGVIDFNPEEFDLVELTNKSLDFINSQSSLKNITIDHNYSSDLIRIVADRKMIETIIRNLLSNAIKFTKQEGNIFVDIHEIHVGVQVSVRDTGVGMDEITKSRLFKLEKNVSTAGTDNELGTGLGLLLCHEFIKMHKGSITVESEPDVGSTFSFIIPKLK